MSEVVKIDEKKAQILIPGKPPVNVQVVKPLEPKEK